MMMQVLNTTLVVTSANKVLGKKMSIQNFIKNDFLVPRGKLSSATNEGQKLIDKENFTVNK